MDTLTRLQELISAMADGELAAHEAELALAALTEPEGRAAWQAYQLIGDALRSDAAGAELSGSFNARLAARLDVEVAPVQGRAASSLAGTRAEGYARVLPEGGTAPDADAVADAAAHAEAEADADIPLSLSLPHPLPLLASPPGHASAPAPAPADSPALAASMPDAAI